MGVPLLNARVMFTNITLVVLVRLICYATFLLEKMCLCKMWPVLGVALATAR